MATSRHRTLLVAASVAVLLAAGATGLGIVLRSRPGSRGRPGSASFAPSPQELELNAETNAVAKAERLLGITLPHVEGAQSPAWTPRVFVRPLPRHQVIGYVPWYELGSLDAADYAATTTVAYDGVDLGPDGAILETGPVWAAFRSPAVENLVSSAHAARDKVILSVFTTSKLVIGSLAKRPAKSAARLASELVPLLIADRFDGVSIDIEGQWQSDRSGFVVFVRDLVHDVHVSDRGALFVLDTYVDSAGNPHGFFDVSALAPLVNTVFVMAYDMEELSAASPDAPIINLDLGYSVVQSLEQYLQVVPARKLVLGVPFYGYDFETISPEVGSPTSNADPTAVTWASIVAAGHHPRWDPGSMTAWYRFKVGKQWHQTWFDDPVSIALKTALASELHLAGVGVWALGMEGTGTAMLDALLGGAPPIKLTPAKLTPAKLAPAKLTPAKLTPAKLTPRPAG